MKHGGDLAILKTAIVDWQRHNVPRLGAAIAYYAIFSIAPLMVIAIAIAGSIFGEQAAKGEVFVQMNRFLGNESAVQGDRGPGPQCCPAEDRNAGHHC